MMDEDLAYRRLAGITIFELSLPADTSDLLAV